MSKAEELANSRWPIHYPTISPKEGEHGEILNFDEWLEDHRIAVQSYSAHYGYIQGYEQAEKDIISIIESRLSELLGDAQPTPILRYELMDLVEKIKED